MMASKARKDSDVVDQMRRSVWRDDARKAGVRDEDIERTVYVRWRLERDGPLGRRVVLPDDECREMGV